MYENFTEHARRIMDLASKEAVKPDNPFLGTEHILIGILQHGKGVAATLLNDSGVDVPRIQSQMDRLFPPDDGQGYWVGNRSLSPGAKQAIKLAGKAADRNRHDAIEAEHLLLGVLAADKGFAPQVLTNLGLDLDDLRQRLMRHLRGNVS